MKRLTPLFLIALLAGCGGELVNPFIPPVEEAPAAPPTLPPEVVSALPPGTSPSVVFPDQNGCYLYSIEVTDPPSGFPVRDAAGNQICPGQPVAMAAASGVAEPSSGNSGMVFIQPEPVIADPLIAQPAPGAGSLNLPVSGDIAAMAGGNG